MTNKTNQACIWKTLPFTAFSGKEVHDFLKLREEIFVVEQNCAYHEIDGKDPECTHVVGSTPDGELIATARIAPAGLIYPEVSIGRVTVREDYRKFGLGERLMQLAIAYCREKLKARSVKIAAQSYLKKFYTRQGFVQISEPYLWDGILHIDMRLSL